MSATAPRRPLAAGNWKMNGLGAARAELESLIERVRGTGADVLICPPATLMAGFAAAASGSAVAIGGQDCHAAEKGAHTGDLSAEMLADAGATAVILGHSERRADHGETDAVVRAKVEAAWRAGLMAILCVGETEAERDAGTTLDVVARQLEGSLPDGADAARLVVAYEPVWAIGTGRTPTLAEIAEVHDSLRARLTDRLGAEAEGVRLLYGGSVKPGNAAEILALENVDGGLVGGASLKATDFAAIVEAAG
ncbi:MAG: triose-phosphate isomerase [Pseudomonadota bacterium]